MANIKHVNSVVDRDFRNRINQLIDFVNAQGKSIQDLVADGQLTEEQYAELLTTINSLLKSGYVDKSDLSPEFKDEIEGFSSQLAQTTNELQNLETNKMDKNTTNIGISQINKNSGKFDQTYMSEVFLQQITGNTPVNAVPADKSLTTEKFADKSVDLGVINDSTLKSLFSMEYKLNVNDFVIGFLGSGDGKEYPSTTRVRSIMIPVRKDTIISLNDYDDFKFSVFKYNLSDRAYISGSYTGWLVRGYTIEEDCYIRVSVGYRDDRDITESDVSSMSSAVNSIKFLDNVLDSLWAKPKTIDTWKLISLGIETGTEVYTTNRVTSNFIKTYKKSIIRVGSSYQFKIFKYSIKDKTFLGSDNRFYNDFTVDEDCYIRVVVAFSDGRDILESDIPTISSSLEITEYLVSENRGHYGLATEEEDGLMSSSDKTKLNSLESKETETYNLFGTFDRMYKVGTLPDFTYTTAQEVFDDYDALVSLYPDMISRNLLGYATATDGTEDTSLPIYEYYVRSNEEELYKNVEDSSYLGKSDGNVMSPTVLITCGVHGNEKSPAWSVYHFIKDLMEKWTADEVIASIKANVNFKIIPVVNPAGYNADTRNNARDVNINRNFGVYWNESPDPYKGSAPYSEFETQIVRDWMEENSNAFAYIDFHTMLRFGFNTASFMDTTNYDLDKIYSTAMRRLSLHWYGKYTDPQEFNYGSVGFIKHEFDPMTFNEAIVNFGIKNSAVIEISKTPRFQDYIYNHVVVETGTELIANYLLALLNAYAK